MEIYKNLFYNQKPEKINPDLAKNGYSIKADIWSLGISLVSVFFSKNWLTANFMIFFKIELATGIHPFADVTFLGLIKRITSDDQSPTLDKGKSSEELCSFVDKWYEFNALI